MELKRVDQKTAMQERISAIVEQAHLMLVETEQDVSTATEVTKGIKTLSKEIKDYFEPERVRTKAAYDAVVSEKKKYADPLDAAEKEIKPHGGSMSGRFGTGSPRRG